MNKKNFNHTQHISRPQFVLTFWWSFSLLWFLCTTFTLLAVITQHARSRFSPWIIIVFKQLHVKIVIFICTTQLKKWHGERIAVVFVCQHNRIISEEIHHLTVTAAKALYALPIKVLIIKSWLIVTDGVWEDFCLMIGFWELELKRQQSR